MSTEDKGSRLISVAVLPPPDDRHPSNCRHGRMADHVTIWGIT